MSFRLPRLQASEIVDKQRRPTLTFGRYWQQFADLIERAINLIALLTNTQEEFEKLIQQTQEAADAAIAAAAAAAAQVAATKREAALQGSFIEPSSVLTATATTITIAAHTRRYTDGTSVAVNGGTVEATAAGDTDYVSYSDPTRAGGNVAYVVSTAPPTQTGNVHVVEAIMIAATGATSGGGGPQRPGYVSAKMGLEPDA